MSDHIDKLIQDATTKLREQEKLVAETKKFINQVCGFAGRPLIYTDDELVSPELALPVFTVTRNAFYGKPLATCVREFLKSRERTGTKEATLNEIMEALRMGCYELDAVTKDVDGQKRGIAISLSKNTTAFHRLPNGDWGLTEWYPNVRAKKEKSGNGRGEEIPLLEPTIADQPQKAQEEDAAVEAATDDDEI